MISRSRALPVVVAVAASACCVSSWSRTAVPAVGATATARSSAADAQTRRAVDAASAFLATLSDTQRKAVLFAFTDSAQRVRWSNFPDGAASRSGVRWGDLNGTQRAALMKLLGTVLSPTGVTMAREQMDADDVLKESPAGAGPPGPSSGGPPGGRPPVNFGSAYYYVSFVGTPSASSPWMLQFGGHHLALNATVVGPNITLSPSLTGGEPLKYTKDGRAVYIVKDEVSRATALLGGLTAAQRHRAVISTQRIDLVLGPGHDGQVLQPEGLPGSAMTGAQKARFLALVEARLGMLNADDLRPALADIRKNLDRTYFAWWGSTTRLGAAYYRVTGPTVLIEYAPQDTDGDATEHAHNMYRNPKNEYGAAWTSLK